MKYKNPYYGQCIHLRIVYTRRVPLSNSYSKARVICNIYKVDVYEINRGDDIPLCCVSLSPYTQKNCAFFKAKQIQLEDCIL